MLAKHYLPHEPKTPSTLVAAKWLDERYWHNQKIATANGIALALKGKD